MSSDKSPLLPVAWIDTFDEQKSIELFEDISQHNETIFVLNDSFYKKWYAYLNKKPNVGVIIHPRYDVGYIGTSHLLPTQKKYFGNTLVHLEERGC